MNRQEINGTIYGKMLDMISCLAIYGGADPAETNHKVTPFELIGER